MREPVVIESSCHHVFIKLIAKVYGSSCAGLCERSARALESIVVISEIPGDIPRFQNRYNVAAVRKVFAAKQRLAPSDDAMVHSSGETTEEPREVGFLVSTKVPETSSQPRLRNGTGYR